jgi:hypothetical protein
LIVANKLKKNSIKLTTHNNCIREKGSRCKL